MARKALIRWLTAMGVLALVLVLSAGTLGYWQAWLYVALLGICSLAFIGYYLKEDPELIRRRLEFHEKERKQKNILRVGWPLFIATYVIPGLDQRFGWSDVPLAAVLASDGVILAGYILFTRVMRENRFASRVIVVEQEQPVITTGPYAIVRHPMYVSALMIYVVSPIALGSYWGMVASVWLIPLLAVRIRGEESLLLKELRGYQEYCGATRYRLIPGVW